KPLQVVFHRSRRELQQKHRRLTILISALLTSHRPTRPTTRTRIGLRALTTYRKITAMPQSTIAAQILEALDVHLNFATKITFDLVVAFDDFADCANFGFG